MRIKNLGFTRVLLNRFRRNDDGATAIEYGLIAALIAIALIASLNQFSTSMGTMFSKVEDTVVTTENNTPGP